MASGFQPHGAAGGAQSAPGGGLEFMSFGSSNSNYPNYSAYGGGSGSTAPPGPGGWVVPISSVSWEPGALGATCQDRGAHRRGAHVRDGAERAAARQLTAPMG